MLFQLPDQVIREVAIGLEYMIIILELVFGMDILNKYLKADKQVRRSDSHFILIAIGISLLLLSFGTLVALISFYYAQVAHYITGWLADGIGAFRHTLQILIVMPYAIIAEKIVWQRLRWKIAKKYVTFSTLVGIGVIIILFLRGLFLIGQDLTDLTYAAGAPHGILDPLLVTIAFDFGMAELALVGFIGFLSILKKLNPHKNEVKLIFKGLFFGAIGLGTWLLGGYFKGLGEVILQIPCAASTVFCVILVYRYLLEIPSYSELEWRKGIIAIYVFDAGGIALYNHDFKPVESELIREGIKQAYKPPADRPSAQLITGGLIGIQSLLSEITQDRGPLGVVTIGGKSLVFKQGKTIITMLMTERDLLVYHSIMRDLVRDIEQSYPDLANRKMDELPELSPLMGRYFTFNS